MAARALLLTLLAACAGTTRTATVREPPPPAEVRVQLDVPPNAPGEDQDLDVGLFRVGSTEARVALDPGGTLYVVSRLAVEPADTRLYRLDPTALVPVELPDSGIAALLGTREDESRALSVAGGPASRRSVGVGRGRVNVDTWPAAGDRPGRLELRGDRAESLAPDLTARVGCTPVSLALASEPIRVAWLDCAAEAPGPAALRVSTYTQGAWAHVDPAADVVPSGRAPELGFDARFQGPRLIAAVVRRPDGAGALLAFEGGAWRSLASLPEVRVGRAGPPTLVAEGTDVLVAWLEPRREGSQVIVRRARRRRWPLVGRGGVDTSVDPARGTRPAVGWFAGDPLVVVPERGGLFVLRWDGQDWQRFGGRVDLGRDADPPVGQVALTVRADGPLVAWNAGGRLWSMERTPSGGVPHPGATGWSGSPTPLAEDATTIAAAALGTNAAVAWIDAAGTAHVRTSPAPGRWNATITALAGADETLDVAVSRTTTWVSLIERASATLHVVEATSEARDLGGPTDAQASGGAALAATSAGEPVVAWPTRAGVRLARRAVDGWNAIDCPSAIALGGEVDRLDLALDADGSAWIAARQRGTSSHVRVARCPLP